MAVYPKGVPVMVVLSILRAGLLVGATPLLGGLALVPVVVDDAFAGMVMVRGANASPACGADVGRTKLPALDPFATIR
jgi:hypothetical protein